MDLSGSGRLRTVRRSIRPWPATTDGYLHSGTWRHRKRDGRDIDVEVASHPIRVGGRQARLVVVTDVTERTRLETRLRETQRLEALGRLAGGVAHEFNNLLAAVLGHAELLLVEMPAGSARRDSAEEIVHAARRGADLTRHMLAFGRRQLLRPEVVDVSAVVRDSRTPPASVADGRRAGVAGAAQRPVLGASGPQSVRTRDHEPHDETHATRCPTGAR